MKYLTLIALLFAIGCTTPTEDEADYVVQPEMHLYTLEPGDLRVIESGDVWAVLECAAAATTDYDDWEDPEAIVCIDHTNWHASVDGILCKISGGLNCTLGWEDPSSAPIGWELRVTTWQ